MFRAIIYLPALVAPVIMGTMYYFIFQYQQGALNTIMTGLGFEKVAWFNNPAVSVAIITIVNSIQFVGVSMIIYLAGLQTLDQSVMEAASLDGASGWKKFWNITLPMLQPAFTTSVVLNLIGGLKLFDIIKVLTNGGPGYATNSISTYISSMYFDAQNAGYASALGVFLFILIAIITYLLNTGLAKLNWEACDVHHQENQSEESRSDRLPAWTLGHLPVPRHRGGMPAAAVLLGDQRLNEASDGHVVHAAAPA